MSAIVSRIPTTWETSLDMTFIQHFAGMSTPFQFPSGWIVDIRTHYLGGGRHFGEWPDHTRRWEIADIGILVQFRQEGRIVRSKVVLLQSKRLYPNEQNWEEDSPLDYLVGFGRLYKQDDEWGDITTPRQFGFNTESRYKALVTGLRQYKSIGEFEQHQGVPVYYLLYHPWQIPHEVTQPLPAGYQVGGSCDVGCRVLPASQLRAALIGQPDGHSPAYSELLRSFADPFSQNQNQAGWRLENFIVDLVLECEAGHIADSPADNGLNYIFNRRSGPISAALAITIDAPRSLQ
ncbi:hypothetical protein [Fodinicola acaciae]|uniref:hypothetical protein n=1 Tax=Fodinicola acaciae TaxID=2681555 RepID=UPI0013D10DD3|nr:hypothetical protein [Fodinicola acaciae]